MTVLLSLFVSVSALAEPTTLIENTELVMFPEEQPVDVELVDESELRRQVRLFQSGIMERGLLPNPFNRGIGQPIDLSERRPLVNLDDSDLEGYYGRKVGYMLVANVSHDGKFWIARIPKYGVKNTYFMLTYFGSYAAHATIRFEMQNNQPVELIAEVPAEEDYLAGKFLSPLRSPIFLKDFVISGEAQWTTTDPEQAYSLVRGAFGQFLHIMRGVSLDERFRVYFATGNPTKMWKLNHTPEEGSRALRLAVQKSESDGINRYYNTLYYNCTNTALAILDSAQDAPRRFFEWVKRTMGRAIILGEVIPILTARYGLHAKGLKPENYAEMEKDPALENVMRQTLDAMNTEDIGANASNTKKLHGIAQTLARLNAPLPERCQILVDPTSVAINSTPNRP